MSEKQASIQFTTNSDEATRQEVRDALEDAGFETELQFPNGEVAVHQ